MLDAAEELLAEGGPDALTVDAVIRRAETSTGSFYARFGDRQGLLLAVQDRFLDRLELAASHQAEMLRGIDDLREALGLVVEGYLDTFRTHRNAFNAIMVQNRSIPSFRERGSLATRSAAASLVAILDERADQVTHPDPAVAADVAFRTLFALATHIVMMDEGEVTGRTLSHTQWSQQTTDLLFGYLTPGR
jgi:AcrR family transcriptional regulator